MLLASKNVFVKVRHKRHSFFMIDTSYILFDIFIGTPFSSNIDLPISKTFPLPNSAN